MIQRTHTYACMHTHTHAHSRAKQADCDRPTTSTHRLLLALFMPAFISCRRMMKTENEKVKSGQNLNFIIMPPIAIKNIRRRFISAAFVFAFHSLCEKCSLLWINLTALGLNSSLVKWVTLSRQINQRIIQCRNLTNCPHLHFLKRLTDHNRETPLHVHGQKWTFNDPTHLFLLQEGVIYSSHRLRWGRGSC